MLREPKNHRFAVEKRNQQEIFKPYASPEYSFSRLFLLHKVYKYHISSKAEDNGFKNKSKRGDES